MQFTRDPIIETIITPKEGFKLIVRNSKRDSGEEFCVDAVQVVTVGNGCFYRSLEKPKPFFVPAGDYEVIESKEAKMVLKIPGSEKGGIKIGGGKQAAPQKAPREPKEEDESPVEEEEIQMEEQPQEQQGRQQERRKEKRRMRRRRGGERYERSEGGETPTAEAPPAESRPPKQPREDKTAYIIPPPNTLISETIARYKEIPGFASAFFEKEGKSEGEPVASNGAQEDELDSDVDGNR